LIVLRTFFLLGTFKNSIQYNKNNVYSLPATIVHRRFAVFWECAQDDLSARLLKT